MNKEKEEFRKKIIEYENGVKDWCIVDNKNISLKPLVDKAFNKIKEMKIQYKNMSDLESDKNENRKIFILKE